MPVVKSEIMSNFDNQHFSPRLANKWWRDRNGKCVVYHRDEGRQPHQGWRSWGQEFQLYPTDVEHALADLERPAAHIYSAMVRGEAPVGADRMKWSQFLLSQVVRTPTFIRYEKFATERHGITMSPEHDRVGSDHCGDLNFVTARDWAILAAHEDDFFIRTDNPVVLTGPLERSETVIYYPLTPRFCFVALPLRQGAVPKSEDPMRGWPIEKGAAHMVNYYCAQQGERSLIVHPDHDNQIGETMLTDPEVLGVYPQPPFLIHEPNQAPADDIYRSVRQIQSDCDGVTYPEWSAADLEGAAQHLMDGLTDAEGAAQARPADPPA